MDVISTEKTELINQIHDLQTRFLDYRKNFAKGIGNLNIVF